MIIESTSLVNGYFKNECGKHSLNKRPDGRVTHSPQISIKDAPENTISFALFMEDRDAIPVCGFSWIHWVACNITQPELEEGSSENDPFYTQGANSWISPLAGSLDRIEASTYGGMAPPDKDHRYDIYIFALDCTLDLKKGFYANELFHAMENHILTIGSISGIYRA